MARIFYDDIVDLAKVEKQIKKIAKTSEEREELYGLVDEIVHHRVLGCILDQLPNKHHEAFLEELGKRPHDVGLIQYLGERIAGDVVEFIREEVHKLTVELLLIVEEATRPKKISS
jgi:hypothetical protein